MTIASRLARRLAPAPAAPASPARFSRAQMKQLRRVLREAAPQASPQSAEPEPEFDILDAYCTLAPSAQTAVDVFAGEWASRLPVPNVESGAAPLFEIEHVPWGVEVLGGVKGGRVVELGPLEGGHTYLLDRMGAAEVVAVEANTRGYLKCLISKELVGIPTARFLLGDAVAYLEQHLARGGEKFDLCLASGILYHLMDPVAALDLMTRSSDRLLLWTMYYDEDYIRSREDLSPRFTRSTERNYHGFEYTLHGHEYQHSLDYKGFCGGSAATSAWMTRETILAAIEFFGFEVVEIGFEEQDHKGNGPCICIAARRRG
jgi:hypothetical protein